MSSVGLRKVVKVDPQPIVSQNESEKSSPEAALDELLAGNLPIHQRADLLPPARPRHAATDDGEAGAVCRNPLLCRFASTGGGAVFDQTIGQLFVTRVAGNMVTAEIMASLEYAAAVLGTHTILVMGHSRCGAVTAAIQPH